MYQNGEKYTKRPQTYQVAMIYLYVPNGRKNVLNGHNMCKYFPFQGLPKCTYSDKDFGYENIPSGNPDPHMK
jgi:hypothetical protein